MRFTGLSIAAMAAVAVADMAANGTSMAPTSTASKGKTYTTVIVTAYTTYCPAATEICIGNNRTVTVKTPGTVTIDKCPCTITHHGTHAPVVPTQPPVVPTGAAGKAVAGAGAFVMAGVAALAL